VEQKFVAHVPSIYKREARSSSSEECDLLIPEPQTAVRSLLADFRDRISTVGHYTLIGECWKGDLKSTRNMMKHVGDSDAGFMLH
jgi:hypothetical protein